MFNLSTSIDIILAGIIGGLLVPIGSIFGAAVVVLLPDLLRFISDFRLTVFGVLLIVVLIYLPEGIGGWLRDRLD